MKKLIPFLLAAFPVLLFAQTAKTSLAFTHVNVIDVKEGSIKKDQTVVITGNRITAVGKKAPIPKSAQVINATGKYLIPGLWDMHAHVLSRWDRAAPLYMANGVTGVRDMATYLSLAKVKDMRRDVLDGKLLGPRFITPGPLLDGPVTRFPRVALLINSEERALKVADSLKEAGADFYKTYDRLPREAFYAIIKKGKEYGLPVAGHIPASVTAEEAAKAGMKSIEHNKFIAPADTNLSKPISKYFRDATSALSNKDTMAAIESNRQAIDLAIKYFDEQDAVRRGRVYAKYNTWVTPTLVQSLKGYYSSQELLNNRNWHYMPPNIVADWTSRVKEKDVIRTDNPAFAKLQLKTIHGFHEGGVRFLAGTDANDAFIGNIPGFSVHQELQLFVKAGLSNLEALQTATLNPAIYLNATDSLGTIAKGKLADLVLLNANPLDDIQNTQKINAAVANGRYFSRKDLDKLLADVESSVNKIN